MGFYVSWLFIALSWAVSLFLAIMAMIKKEWRKSAAICILIIGVSYNLVFAEEYVFGKINGSSSILLSNALKFIKQNDKIKSVITYNDIGAYELTKLGKYERRIYAIPKNEEVHKGTLNNFKGYYLVVDVPHLSQDSLYGRYFASCDVVYRDQSGYISARIYDCKNAIHLD